MIDLNEKVCRVCYNLEDTVHTIFKKKEEGTEPLVSVYGVLRLKREDELKLTKEVKDFCEKELKLEPFRIKIGFEYYGEVPGGVLVSIFIDKEFKKIYFKSMRVNEEDVFVSNKFLESINYNYCTPIVDRYTGLIIGDLFGYAPSFLKNSATSYIHYINSTQIVLGLEKGIMRETINISIAGKKGNFYKPHGSHSITINEIRGMYSRKVKTSLKLILAVEANGYIIKHPKEVTPEIYKSAKKMLKLLKFCVHDLADREYDYIKFAFLDSYFESVSFEDLKSILDMRGSEDIISHTNVLMATLVASERHSLEECLRLLQNRDEEILSLIFNRIKESV